MDVYQISYSSNFVLRKEFRDLWMVMVGTLKLHSEILLKKTGVPHGCNLLPVGGDSEFKTHNVFSFVFDLCKVHIIFLR